MSRLLLEVGTEAIPAGYVPRALAALQSAAQSNLAKARLSGATVSVLGTAKRLVLIIEDLPAKQENVDKEVQGPRVDIAFKDGKATKAAEGFARKNGLSVDELERVTSDRGEFVLARVHEVGRSAGKVLTELLPRWIEDLEWPKTMVWNASRFRFPRPVRWVVCLLDDKVLPIAVAGIPAGRNTMGQRLLGPGSHTVADAGKLAEVLREAGVLLDPQERQKEILTGLEREAESLGGTCLSDPRLVDEVAYLVEAPSVFSGRFDTEFLELPREIVVTAMRSHQRYFAVEDKQGDLLPNFLVVTDGKWKDATQVLAGNERVLRARLADAKFYWDVDLKTGMDGLSSALGNVVWLESVGTLFEKTERVAHLVNWVGETLYDTKWNDHRDDAHRAAVLSKADLASEMIKDGKEFTGLQGIMGARYAQAEGASPAVVAALGEQYLPRGAQDPLPESIVGTALAFADRLDTVAGCMAAGFIPTGSQDPYALRRAANGMIRMLLEKDLHLSVNAMVKEAVGRLPESVQSKDLGSTVLTFLGERVASLLREGGIRYDVVDAVLSADAQDPVDARARAQALEAIRDEEDLERLVVGFKRAANILKGMDEGSLPDPQTIDWSKTEAAEKTLSKSIEKVSAALAGAREKKNYPDMLKHLLELRGPIDTFFDDVMVMSDVAEERDRRLALLAWARGLFHNFFDPARIVIEGE